MASCSPDLTESKPLNSYWSCGSHGQQAPAGTGLVFASRRAAIVLESGYGTRIVAENPDMNFGMTSLPPGPRGSARAVTGWVNMLAIPTGAKNPELAWEWIKYFAGLEGQLKFFGSIWKGRDTAS